MERSASSSGSWMGPTDLGKRHGTNYERSGRTGAIFMELPLFQGFFGNLPNPNITGSLGPSYPVFRLVVGRDRERRNSPGNGRPNAK